MKGEVSYAFKILDNITVLTNNVLFRKYQLTQVADGSGYERVSQIQEFNGVGEGSNPVLFSYEQTAEPNCFDVVSINPITIQNRNLCPTTIPFNLEFNLSPVKTGGDFNGDGQTDYVTNNFLLYSIPSGYAPIVLPNTGTSMSISTLTNNKMNQSRSLLRYKRTDNSHYEFNVYDLINNSFAQAYAKTIELNMSASFTCKYSPSACGPCNFSNYSSVVDLEDIVEGDFDGNGISEIIFVRPSSSFVGSTYYDVGSHQIPSDCKTSVYPVSPVVSGNFYMLDLDPNKSTTLGSDGFVAITSSHLSNINQKRFVQDFNGDGKSDIMILNGASYKIIEFNKIGSTVSTSLIGEGILSYYADSKPLLFGDYNGDGKQDILVPLMDSSPYWTIFYSNPNPIGGAFFREETFPSIVYKPFQGGSTYQDSIQYFAKDINNDGKTDLVTTYTSKFFIQNTLNNWDSKWLITGYTNNTGKGGERFIPTHMSPLGWSDNPDSPIVFNSNYRLQEKNNNLAIINYFDQVE